MLSFASPSLFIILLVSKKRHPPFLLWLGRYTSSLISFLPSFSPPPPLPLSFSVSSFLVFVILYDSDFFIYLKNKEEKNMKVERLFKVKSWKNLKIKLGNFYFIRFGNKASLKFLRSVKI